MTSCTFVSALTDWARVNPPSTGNINPSIVTYGDFKIPHDQPLTLKYRVVAYDGTMPAADPAAGGGSRRVIDARDVVLGADGELVAARVKIMSVQQLLERLTGESGRLQIGLQCLLFRSGPLAVGINQGGCFMRALQDADGRARSF